MSKSDLKARPVFHHTRDSIEAHLTVVFADASSRAASILARGTRFRRGTGIDNFARRRTGFLFDELSAPCALIFPHGFSMAAKRPVGRV
ncbi:MAG: hypothetical protein AB2L09_01175 [Coriobacteriia bacterium]